MVTRASGALVYCFMRQKEPETQEAFISGFLAAMQMFAKDMFSHEDNEIRSVSLSKTIFTFRTLTVKDNLERPMRFHFVLFTDADKPQVGADDMLEYLIVSFLGYDKGSFRRKLADETSGPSDFAAFDKHVGQILEADLNSVMKNVKPVPGSLIQGVVNELRNYLPLSQVLALHPQLVRVGSSYAWLSDDLPSEEETLLLDRIRQLLTRLYGRQMYESIVADVVGSLPK